MKNSLITITAIVATCLLTSCASQQNLTNSQKCTQIKRQIVAVQQPNSGYSGDLSGYKAEQLQEQAKALGC